MNDYSFPCILLKKYLREYYALCNDKQYAKAYEVAVDISDLALQLETIAQELADDNAKS